MEASVRPGGVDAIYIYTTLSLQHPGLVTDPWADAREGETGSGFHGLRERWRGGLDPVRIR
jgi:hypothetical protein